MKQLAFQVVYVFQIRFYKFGRKFDFKIYKKKTVGKN